MTGKMILRPGTPDDDNREYLPEKIKGSDIVVIIHSRIRKD